MYFKEHKHHLFTVYFRQSFRICIHPSGKHYPSFRLRIHLTGTPVIPLFIHPLLGSFFDNWWILEDIKEIFLSELQRPLSRISLFTAEVLLAKPRKFVQWQRNPRMVHSFFFIHHWLNSILKSKSFCSR